MPRRQAGRACLGIGCGDSALAHIGSAPAKLKPFEACLIALQGYLSGAEVPFDLCPIPADVAPPVAEPGLDKLAVSGPTVTAQGTDAGR
ncbi:MAG: hypothetical protein R3E82_09715 [Pseudomonadales bacterium]|nr:hypothetical protein [Pseudomonadales bacterium]